MIKQPLKDEEKISTGFNIYELKYKRNKQNLQHVKYYFKDKPKKGTVPI